MKLVGVTTNEGKRQTLEAAVGQHGHTIDWQDYELLEIQVGTTAEIAAQKAKDIWKREKTDDPTIASAAAFCLTGLGNFPGVYAAHYMRNSDQFIQLLYRALGDIDPRCYFEESLAVFSDGRVRVSTQKIYGSLLRFHSDGGRSAEFRLIDHLSVTTVPEWAWSDLWKVFKPESAEFTLAELDRDRFLSWWKESGFHHDGLLTTL